MLFWTFVVGSLLIFFSRFSCLQSTNVDVPKFMRAFVVSDGRKAQLSTGNLVSVLQHVSFRTVDNSIAICKSDIMNCLDRLDSDSRTNAGGKETAVRTLERCLARSVFHKLEDAISSNNTESYKIDVLRIVLRDFGFVVSAPVWEATIRQLNQMTLPGRRAQVGVCGGSSESAVDAASNADSVSLHAGLLPKPSQESLGDTARMDDASSVRSSRKRKHELLGDEEFDMYQRDFAGYSWSDLLRQVMVRDQQIKNQDSVNKKQLVLIESLKKKNKLLGQQARRSAQTSQRWAAKAKAKVCVKKAKGKRPPILPSNVDERMAIERTGAEGNGRYLTVESRISLSLRRNCSNVACADLGLILLDDSSRWTIARSEVQTGASLIGHAKSFHSDMESELGTTHEKGSCGVAIHCISQDATNGNIWQKRKLVAMLLHTAYCSSLPTDDSFSGAWTWDLFTSLECVGDIQPVLDGSGGGTVGLTHKMLQSVGCPSIESLVGSDQETTTSVTSQTLGLQCMAEGNNWFLIVLILNSYSACCHPCFGRVGLT